MNGYVVCVAFYANVVGLGAQHLGNALHGSLSGVNYFFSLTTIISPYQRQLLLDC
jgi:hypothetical protein